MTAATRVARAAGLALGYVAGRLIDHPARREPVAAFNRVATAVEDRTYADDANWGIVHTAALVGGVAGAGLIVERLTRRKPVLRALATAAATVAVLPPDRSEDGSDAGAVAPLLWGGAFGIPGLLGYRAAKAVADQIGAGLNGTDEEKYVNFGQPAAQLGELIDWLPDRVTSQLAEFANSVPQDADPDGNPGNAGASTDLIELAALALAALIALTRAHR